MTLQEKIECLIIALRADPEAKLTSWSFSLMLQGLLVEKPKKCLKPKKFKENFIKLEYLNPLPDYEKPKENFKDPYKNWYQTRIFESIA